MFDPAIAMAESHAVAQATVMTSEILHGKDENHQQNAVVLNINMRIYLTIKTKNILV